MKKITGGEAIVKALSFLNVDTIFGIPGVHNLAIYAALSNSDIHHVTGRHEQEVGFMADGYARTSGCVGVALVISGPGLTNILTAMGEAFHEAIPLLVISTNNASRHLAGRDGRLHELAQSNTMVRSVAKESRRVPCTEAIIHYLIEGYHLAQSGRPAPVHVEIPLDLLQQDIAAPTDDALRSMAAVFAPPSKDDDPQGLHHAATLLQKAKQPLIIAGGGAWQAAANIRRLAEKLAAPVMLTPAAKGTLNDEHPLCLGVRRHFAAVRRYLRTVDVLLAVGTELTEDL
jgi:thiamine pyrophosphate-dependent acetolactate synthase large subunit-like protein